jgi:hypothetical protein
LEGLLLGEWRRAGRGRGDAEAALRKPAVDDARAFLKRAAACDEKRYESVGLGWAYRYAGAEVVGSALAFNDSVVHMAFFSVDGAASMQDPGGMAGSRTRRGFRI